MQRISLAGTSLDVSRLGFGTASLHHLLRRKDREALLGAALDSGFTHFDTARMYGEGTAERTLGQYLGSRRQQLTLATKFGIPADPFLEKAPILIYPKRALGRVTRRISRQRDHKSVRCLTRRCLDESLRLSLRALQTDWIDILFVHEPRPEDRESLLALAEHLDRVRKSGMVRYLGLAGKATDCVEIANSVEGLFDVLQVEDTLENHEADTLGQAGKPLQITYGYLRRAEHVPRYVGAGDLVKRALARNAHGCVLVSSRNPERVRALARCAA
ncbi:aldo/keto reductase [Wenzhouxiangella sediminis]|uniref:Aldo/keto reductase n=1 Tax=Wenzhouxiangella sediminis TaxID=1792836 RepID=A0A3E1K6J0_9GAMM|nr:aldo/keto reductase [Wenzhouxiangella sediminis]RFF29580.1 aldo/keto reductase [Wenzhouxiangella sediminis]